MIRVCQNLQRSTEFSIKKKKITVSPITNICLQQSDRKADPLVWLCKHWTSPWFVCRPHTLPSLSWVSRCPCGDPQGDFPPAAPWLNNPPLQRRRAVFFHFLYCWLKCHLKQIFITFSVKRSPDDPPLHRCVGFTGLEWQVLSHLGVDDADGGFIPHVSLVPFRRRGVETQDGIVSVWRMRHSSEWKRVTNWPRGRNDTLEITQNAAAPLEIGAQLSLKRCK